MTILQSLAAFYDRLDREGMRQGRVMHPSEYPLQFQLPGMDQSTKRSIFATTAAAGHLL